MRGRRGLWSCCDGCIAPLLSACGEGGCFSSHRHRGGFGPAVPRKQAFSPTETGVEVFFLVGFFFSILNVH